MSGLLDVARMAGTVEKCFLMPVSLEDQHKEHLRLQERISQMRRVPKNTVMPPSELFLV